MTTGIYRFADVNVALSTASAGLHRWCNDYRTEETPDCTVAVTRQDIDLERLRSQAQAVREQEEPICMALENLEATAAYRKLCETLVDYRVLMLHGSAVAVDGQGYLFTARSGTGKSTHTRLWREMLGSRAVMVNDDKPLLRVAADSVFVYGTPWSGKHHLNTNIAVPLKAICILQRDTVNHIGRIAPREAFATLVQQCNRPFAPQRVALTMNLLSELTHCVAFYRLGCNMEPEAAQIAYQTMKETVNADTV